jgi:pimeloyl-ACP methyl ester carboxylesterase
MTGAGVSPRQRWRWSRALAALLLVASGCSACSGSDRSADTPAPGPRRDGPLPEPVVYRDSPEGVTLADPALEALPGATVDTGRLGGAVYQIEVPDDWNGGLVMWMHGYAELAPVASVAPPDFRRYLIANGYAWAASSYSSTSFIPQRGADETAALWDHFVRQHGRPDWTYAAGFSMGGWSAKIAAERYGDRYDGALALCGATGTVPGLRVSPDYLVVGAFVAGVHQADIDASPDIGRLVDQRIRPALANPARRAEFDEIMIDLTGGPRAFAVEGIHDEEDTNFQRAVLVASTGLGPQPTAAYHLGPDNPVTSDELNRAAVVIPTGDGYADYSAGMEVTGDLAMPLLTLHTTGDGQVPINQALILRDRVEAAGRSDLLVQRVIEDPGHCGFTTGEQEAAFGALADWVERGDEPAGTELGVDDLTHLDRTFEDHSRTAAPRPGSRVTIRGRASLDGRPLTARWIGAVVEHDGLVTPCNVTLPPSEDGRYEIDVYTDEASAGCGRPGAEVVLWTFTGDVKLYATAALPWPVARTGAATTTALDVEFTTTDPSGAAGARTELSGEVYDNDSAHRHETGSRVEAYIGTTRCGVASVRENGFYILTIAGPDTIAGCTADGRIHFEVDGHRATETAVNAPEQASHLDLTAPL